MDEKTFEDFLLEFRPGTRVIVDVVFPGEYKVGFETAFVKYVPGSGSYYSLLEAVEKAVAAYLSEARREVER